MISNLPLILWILCRSSGEEIGKNFKESKNNLMYSLKIKFKVNLVKTWAMTQISKKNFPEKIYSS